MATSDSPVIFEGARVELAHGISAELGEGAIWLSDLGLYASIDIYGPSKLSKGPAVFLHNPYDAAAKTRCIPMPSFCGTVVPRKRGGLVVALKDGIYAVDMETGTLTLLVNPENVPTNRWNDGKCAPDGRFWAGTMGEPGKVNPNVGALYVVNADLSARMALSDVTISNGLAWDTARGIMYYIDTPKACVYAFDYDAATGGISNQRVAFPIPPGTGHPDGCCLDASGNLWVAQWGGARVIAYRPTDGAIVAEVRLPAAHVSSCTFGGPGLTDLYITTAKEHLSPEELAAQPHAGDSFIVRATGFTGVPAGVFSG
jgi:sugar lactone lactonase YvrE